MQDTVFTRYIAKLRIRLSMESTVNKSRYGRGWVLAASAHIRRLPKVTKAQLWKVESESRKDTYYNVILKSNDEMTCDCPDFENRKEFCKHIYACILYETT